MITKECFAELESKEGFTSDELEDFVSYCRYG